MAASFKRVGGDRVRVRLTNDEVAILRGLPDQLRTVLGEGEDEPVNRRLFPPAYLDVAEDMALRKIPMTMQDWETRLNASSLQPIARCCRTQAR